jgi:large subunit ribosomal protein L15
MKLTELRPAKGAKTASKRVGRGKGSGLGRTAGRGEKGLRSRSGGGTPPGYEGGQMPLQRRIPKRGFHNVFRKEYSIVNVKDLNRFDAGSLVDIDALRAAGIVKNVRDGIKLLGDGEVTRAVTVKVDKASKEAARKVLAAGGTLEVTAPC